MDEKFIELKFMEAITEANYHLVRSILGSYMEVATSKKLEDFQALSEEEQIKILDKDVKVGKVFQMLSLILTQTLNKKIETDSAIKAYTTESMGKEKGKENGTK